MHWNLSLKGIFCLVSHKGMAAGQHHGCHNEQSRPYKVFIWETKCLSSFMSVSLHCGKAKDLAYAVLIYSITWVCFEKYAADNHIDMVCTGKPLTFLDWVVAKWNVFVMMEVMELVHELVTLSSLSCLCTISKSGDFLVQIYLHTYSTWYSCLIVITKAMKLISCNILQVITKNICFVDGWILQKFLDNFLFTVPDSLPT